MNEPLKDKNGGEVKIGDILDSQDETDPWRYLVCFANAQGEAEVRDLNANNVGWNSDVPSSYVVLGNYKEHPGILDDDDLFYYFDIIEMGSEKKYSLECFIETWLQEFHDNYKAMTTAEQWAVYNFIEALKDKFNIKEIR